MEKKYKSQYDPDWIEFEKKEEQPQPAEESRGYKPKSLEEIENSAKIVSFENDSSGDELETSSDEEADEAAKVNEQNDADESKIEALLDAPSINTTENAQPKKEEKLKRFFFSFGMLIKRHKVVSSIIIVVFVLALSALLTVNHYLNKINIVSDESTSQAQEKLKFITLSTGEIIDVTHLTRNKDGTYNLPDGRRFNRDRTIWNTDGSMVFYDGSYMLPDGTAVLADGTTFYTNELLVFQNGSFFENTKIKVDKEGYVSFFNGIIAHLTNFICSTDGTCTAKTSAISNLKHEVSGTWNAFDKDKGTATNEINNDDDGEESKIKEALSQADGLNDDEIAENYNNNEIWYNDNVKNILLMGIDQGGKNYPYGRSDSMIILSINKQTKAVKMVSLSRAAYVAIAGYDNTRLNHAHGYGGAALAIDTIERNYKIRIDNYVETGFDTFKKIIDTLDGVTIDLTSAEAKALKAKIKKAGMEYNGAGRYKLNGELALEYVRLRKIDTDRARTARQRKVLLAIANKFKNSNFLQMSAVANQILPLITTDMSKTEILAQLSTAMSYLNGDVEQYVIPNKATSLTLIDNFEVLVIDWKYEVKYLHNALYEGLVPSYYAK